MKNRKSSCNDCINAELLKKGIIVTVKKKEDSDKRANYKKITLKNVTYKVLSTIIREIYSENVCFVFSSI